MRPIPIPRPKAAMNLDRPANALLLAQVHHLQHAERLLPLRYRSEIYIHAIKTEGEAAEYIREVTDAIHRAHADAEKKRAKPKKGLQLAASAARPARKKSKKKPTKSKRK